MWEVMNWDAQREELSILNNIYCGEGEFAVVSGNFSRKDLDEDVRTSDVLYPVILSVRLTISHHVASAWCNVVVVMAEFSLSHDYPGQPPGIRLRSPYLQPQLVDSLGLAAAQVAASLVPEPSLFQILEHMKQVVVESLTDNPALLSGERTQPLDSHPLSLVRAPPQTSCPAPTPAWPRSCYHCLVQLDHMRNEIRYAKSLRSLCASHGVKCRVVNAGGHCIYVLLEGNTREAVSKFIKEWKTTNVDVDSQGRPCKERLMTVVSEGEHSQHGNAAG